MAVFSFPFQLGLIRVTVVRMVLFHQADCPGRKNRAAIPVLTLDVLERSQGEASAGGWSGCCLVTRFAAVWTMEPMSETRNENERLDFDYWFEIISLLTPLGIIVGTIVSKLI